MEEEIASLEGDFDGIEERAKDEIEALGDFEKIKAAGKTALLVAGFPKIPAKIKEAVTDIRFEIQSLKELQKTLNGNLA